MANLSIMTTMNACFSAGLPVNKPVLGYARGTPERAALRGMSIARGATG